MANTSYYLYQRYIKYPSNDDWVPVYPMEFSVSGDSEDPMPMVMKMDEDPACGGDSPTPIFPIYQWVNIPISEEYECSGGNKYYVEIYQVSYDNGRTWQNVEPEQRKRGSVYEYQSEDCGYPPQTRTLTTATTCIGYDKYTLEEYQVSYDSGATWETTGTSATTLIEADSPDCGYVPPTPTYRWYQLPISEDSICSAGTKYYVDIYQVSYDNGITWQDVAPRQTRRGVVYEYNSPDCIEYRWTEIPITSGYICDDCPEAQYRTLTTATTCIGYDKYTLEEYQVSYDSGVTWTTTGTSATTLIEADSEDCGYVPYDEYYLTFIPTTGNSTFTWNSQVNTVKYSLDSGSTWATLSSGETTPSVSAGQKIMWKGTCATYQVYITNGIGTFSSSDKFEIEGNPMSLLFEDNFVGQYDLTGKNSAFRMLFSGNTNVVSAENMVLPATTLSDSCYYNMFKGCTNLINAPIVLPATVLTDYCYCSMFQGCSSLTTTPVLPATTLATQCYASMFRGCTSLMTTPELSAMTLAERCYSYMFQGCSNLTATPSVLPATTLADYCYYNMFSGCTSLATAPSSIGNSSTVMETNSCSNMFYGCTSLTTAPALPATTLAYSCYSSMFNGCTSLTTVSSVLPAKTLASSCYASMFYGCTNLLTAPQLSATTLAEGCCNRMFYGCTSLTTAPQLHATTLANGCYQYMFYNCSSLNYVKCIATTNVSSNQISSWLYNVAATGTFVKDANTTWPSGATGIPTGWTVQNYNS